LVNRAVFLDRDGVIIQEPPHYAHLVSQIQFIPRSVQGIKLLNENGFLTIVITNQAGVARGYYPEEDTVKFNNALKKMIARQGARIDAMYYCPHHPEAKIEKYRIDCECRKPRPGMLKKAEKEFSIELKQSFMIGDKLTDIQAGRNAGCKTIMVKTGMGAEELRTSEVDCDYIADDLYDAVEHVLSLSGRKKQGIAYRRNSKVERYGDKNQEH